MFVDYNYKDKILKRILSVKHPISSSSEGGGGRYHRPPFRF